MAEVIILSRNRIELAQRSAAVLAEQGYSITLMTEPSQRRAYAEALAPRGVEVLAQAEPDKGLGYARVAALKYAGEQKFAAFIMADDDTIPKKGSADDLIRFVLRERAFLCGPWMQVHNAWYGRELGETPGMVIPHFGDKFFAVNTRMALEAGNWHPGFISRENAEMLRRSIRHGYLWWTHTSVHVKEIVRAGAPGGIQGYGASREEKIRHDYALAHFLWPDYVSAPSVNGRPHTRTRMRQMIENFINPEAARAYKAMKAYRDDDPTIPCRVGPLRVRLPIGRQGAFAM